MKYVEIGTCVAGAIVGWLKDYANYAESTSYLPENDLEQIRHIADWLFERAEETDRKNNNRNGGKHDGKF